MGNFTITDSLRRAFQEMNITFFVLRIAEPEEFYEAIGKAKQQNEHGAFVTQQFHRE